jgi:hypothetical protein
MLILFVPLAPPCCLMRAVLRVAGHPVKQTAALDMLRQGNYQTTSKPNIPTTSREHSDHTDVPWKAARSHGRYLHFHLIIILFTDLSQNINGLQYHLQMYNSLSPCSLVCMMLIFSPALRLISGTRSRQIFRRSLSQTISRKQ